MKLISEYGNEICHTDDERKIERLKRQGFTEVKEEKNIKRTNSTVLKKKGATNNAKRKSESNTETDI